jgi:hypothetical protein
MSLLLTVELCETLLTRYDGVCEDIQVILSKGLPWVDKRLCLILGVCLGINTSSILNPVCNEMLKKPRFVMFCFNSHAQWDVTCCYVSSLYVEDHTIAGAINVVKVVLHLLGIDDKTNSAVPVEKYDFLWHHPTFVIRYR